MDTDPTYYITDIPEKFCDIAPYNDKVFHEKMASLVKEPGFEHAIRYIMPEVDYPDFVQKLLTVSGQKEFQERIMGEFLEFLVARTSSGLSLSGTENIINGTPYTFLSNHRDIVLDASLLNLCMIREHIPLTQIAIGNNLLIYEWITDLVKINRSFIVKRDVKKLQALEAARQLSEYIHYTIGSLHESVWIAQRQGRAKDSNDLTQESLLKMLAIGGDSDIRRSLSQLNIIPTAISYEYDPNDYLKVREYLQKRRDPEFKKSQHDDLLSMETGILQPKGRIHFHMGQCINDRLAALPDMPRPAMVKEICRIIDSGIHSGYMIYPINYMAFDLLSAQARFAEHYTAADVDRFEKYIAGRIALIDLKDINDDERQYMRHMMLTMYANPLKNKLAAI